MNTFGQVLAWLTVVAALVATFFTSKLVDVRNSYARKLHAQTKRYDAVVPELDKKRIELATLKSQSLRAEKDWGTVKDETRDLRSETKFANPAQGVLSINLGSNHGIAEKSRIYGFELSEDGTSKYRGVFVAEKVGPAQCEAKLDGRIRKGDVDGWVEGTWRWRQTVPFAQIKRFSDLQYQLFKLDDEVKDRNRTISIQQEILEGVQAQLETRKGELLGDENKQVSPTALPEEKQGLISALAAVEEQRNAQLAKVDELRRKVRQERRLIDDLQAKNQHLVSRLPQPASNSTAKLSGR